MERKLPPEIPKDEIKFPTRTGSVAQSSPRGFRWLLIGIILALVLILVGLVGWLYMMQQATPTQTPTPTRPTAAENNEPESSTAEAAATTQAALSPSTELDAIETDVAGTDIVELAPLFADIEAMFTDQ